MVKQLMTELHFDNNTTGTQAETDAKVAIIDSINFTKRQKAWFNERRHTIYSSDGVFGYPLPNDFMGLVGNVYYTASDNDPLTRVVLRYRSPEWCEEHKSRGEEWDTSVNSGNPDFYSIDAGANEMLLVPIPYQDGDKIEFKYVVDDGVPTYKVVSTTWTFYLPNSSETLPATFTNVWFTSAYRMIFARAAYYLLTGAYGGTEAAMVKGTEYIKQWAEELNKLRAETKSKASPRGVRRHI